MFCTKCGSEIEAGAIFCTNCGARVDENGEMKLSLNSEKEKAGKSKRTAVIAGAAVLFIGITTCLIKGNVGSLDDLWEIYESEEDYYEETLQFDRSYYISNAISIEEFLRYREYGPCFLERYVVDSVPEDRLYICRNSAGSQWVVIDDRGCSLSSNALPGDMVTVYGRYNDVVELTFTDGSMNNQVPMVYADKLVDNSMNPEDYDEFISQVIQCMNSSDIMYGSESEYYGDYNAKIAIGLDFGYVNWFGGSDVDLWTFLTKENYFGGWYVGRVDGYAVSFELEGNENLSDPYQSGLITDEDVDLAEKNKEYYYDATVIPVYASGRITYIERVDYVIKITFCIDSIDSVIDI